MTISPRQFAALELAFSIAWDSKLKPRNEAQAEMVRSDAKAALEALRMIVGQPDFATWLIYHGKDGATP